MTASGGTSSPGFETAFRLVGGHGRFQWLALGICALQLVMMTWNHMGYIFMGAVPKHWCHIQQLENSTWSLDQVKNISIPKVYSKASGEESDWKYDQCQYYAIDYQLLLEQSKGNFEVAYELVHQNHQGDANNNDENSSLPMPPTEIPPPPLSLKTCQAWSYDNSIYKSTIVTEFDLVCGRRYLVASIQALYMIGAFSGTLIFGPLGDTILGRRKTALIGIVLVIIGGFFSSFSTSYLMFVTSRFLVAMGTAGTMQASGVWFLEHCDTKSRARMYCISALFFGVGYAIMPVYAYYIRTWSNLQLAFSLTTLSLLSFYWIFPESPRWLASHGRDEEAVKALERIAHFNKVVPKPERVDLLKCVRQCYLYSLDESMSGNNENEEHANADLECKQSMLPTTTTTTGSNPQENGEHWKNKCTNTRVNKEKQQTKKIGILKRITSTVKNYSELVRTPQLRRISFVMWILFVAVAFVYYGFAFSSGNLTTSPYLLVSLGALMEIPASVLPIPFLSRWGRRPSTVVCYLLTGLAALSIAVTPSNYEGVRTVLSMIGKLFVASAFTVIYFVVSEAYPTVVRSTGQGAGTLMGRVGSISAPYVADMLTTVYPDLPSVIFGIVAIVAAFVALFIPEMKNVDMKDQLYELQQDSLKKSSGGKLQINHEETAA